MRSEDGSSAPTWLGGVAMLVVTSGVPAVFGLATDGMHMSIGLTVLGVLAVVAGICVLALVAPLVGHQRWYALCALVPFWNLWISWRFGVTLAELGRQRRSPAGRPVTAHQ